MSEAARTIQCPNCTRKFFDNNGVLSHIKKKHQGRGAARFRPEQEESFADRAIEAELDRAMGIPNDDIDWLIP